MSSQPSDYAKLLGMIRERLQNSPSPFLIGIAGPPATGKSTLSKRLANDLNAAGLETCVCPMDGFHMTNAQLDAAGLRDAKGRIDTFEGKAFARAVSRLKEGAPFWWPQYSRQSHDPIPKGTRITGKQSVCIVEGNYILTDEEPWRSAAEFFDLRVIMDASDTAIRLRLLNRHLRGGRSVKLAMTKINLTDMPNAQDIRNGYGYADILLTKEARV